MNYQTLDIIADSYIPLLALLSLYWLIILSGKRLEEQDEARKPCVLPQKSLFRYRLLGLAILLGTAYGLMFLDNLFHLWPSVGLDYSTHTAVALVLIIYLILLKPEFKFLWGLSLIAYCGLMYYQRYHIVADMVSTATTIMLILLLLAWLLFYAPPMCGDRRKLSEMFPALKMWRRPE